MEFISQFFSVFLGYASELWYILLIGFLLSGFFYQFIPSSYVETHLGVPGLKPILLSSIVGIILPVCCVGSLPIALTLRRKGASLGSVLAFLVATPATSISALIVCWKLLGLNFTLYIFAAVTLMVIVMGIIISGVNVEAPIDSQSGHSCCDDEKNLAQEGLSFKGKLLNVFQYGLIKLPKDIGVEVLIGIALASFVTVFNPLQTFIAEYLQGLLGYAFVLVVGLVTYVCSTASVPLADAFIQSGLSSGQALCYLIVGPITSYGTILVIRKDFGNHILFLYLSIICIFSLICGTILDVFLHQI